MNVVAVTTVTGRGRPLAVEKTLPRAKVRPQEVRPATPAAMLDPLRSRILPNTTYTYNVHVYIHM